MNNFCEYSMIDPAFLAPCFGFTKEEVKMLCKKHGYPAKIADYTGDILLVGINYDKETKQHTCKIKTYHP